jgi:ribokinase
MAKRPRIAVVGSANIDLTTFTAEFPKPGETIFGQKFDLGFGGKGANQAVAARLCGADVFMVARVGSDLFGPATIENFKKLGIDAREVKQVEGLSSGVAPIFVDPSGQNRILVVKGANDALKPADVDAAAETLKSVDCIVLQFEIPIETVYYTVAFARKNNIRCIVNPAPATHSSAALRSFLLRAILSGRQCDALISMQDCQQPASARRNRSTTAHVMTPNGLLSPPTSVEADSYVHIVRRFLSSRI